MAKVSDVLAGTGGNVAYKPGPSFNPTSPATGPIASQPLLRTPFSQQQSNQGNFNTRWQARIRNFTNTGVKDDSIKPVYNWDKDRVEKGQKPFTDAQVVDFVSSLHNGQPVVGLPKEHQGGISLDPLDFIGNITSDIGDIAQGLNPIKLIPAVYNQLKTVGDNPEVLTKFLNAPNFDSAMNQLGNTPLLSMVPGVFTATHALTGDFKTLIEHPVSTFLDVSMIGSELGKLGAAARIGSLVEGSTKLADAASWIDTSKSLGEDLINKATQHVNRAAEFTKLAEENPLPKSPWISGKDFTTTAAEQSETAARRLAQAHADAAYLVQSAVNDYNHVYSELIPKGSPLEALAAGPRTIAPATGASLEDIRPGVGKTNIWKAGSRLPVFPVKGAAGIVDAANTATEAAKAEQVSKVAEAANIPGDRVYRYSNVPIETAVSYPQGAFVAPSSEDWSWMGNEEQRLERGMKAGTAQQLGEHTIYPQNPLMIEGQSSGVAGYDIIRHLKGTDEANRLYDMVNNKQYKQAAQYAIDNFGIKVRAFSRPTYYPQQLDSIAGQLARQEGYDTVIIQGAKRTPETIILDKNVLAFPTDKAEAAAREAQEATQPAIDKAMQRQQATIAENPLKVGLTGPGSITERLAQYYNVDKNSREALRAQAFGYRQGAYHPEYTILRDTYKKDQELALAAKERDQMQLQAWQNKPMGDPNRTAMIDRYTKAVRASDRALKKATDSVDRVAMADVVHTTWNLVGERTKDIIQKYMNQGKTGEEARALLDKNYHTLDEYAGKLRVNQNFKKYVVGQHEGMQPIIDTTTGDTHAAGPSLSDYVNVNHGLMKDVWIPNHVFEPMMSLQGVESSKLAKLYGDTTNVFKYAVLTGPRHVAHVLFSNGMFLALDDMKNYSPRVIMEAFNKYREGPEAWPDMLPTGSGGFAKERRVEVAEGNLGAGIAGKQPFGKGPVARDIRSLFTAQDFHAMASGKTMGRILKTFPDGFRRMEDTITDMSRLMAYYSAGGGDAGLLHATRVLMDVDGMSGFERQVLRQIFPFYPFTRQLFQYMTRYPIDHPVKAGILGAIGRIEMQDWGKGLPEQMMTLFPVSGMDSKGNSWVMDTKSLNPFRSLNGLNPFTLAGFLSEQNPLITAASRAAGLNVLTATPELYPQLTVDPRTGDLVAVHPNAAWTIAESVVPEATLLESLIGHSANLSQLAQTNPGAYARLIASTLNMPFIPSAVNYNQERIRYAKNLFTVTQGKVSAAAKSGNVDTLPYEYVPYQGRIYKPGELAQNIAQSDVRRKASQTGQAGQGTVVPFSQRLQPV